MYEIIGGLAVSVLMQYMKKMKLTKVGRYTVLLGLSLLGGVIVYLFREFGYMESFLEVLATSQVVYGFIFANIKK